MGGWTLTMVARSLDCHWCSQSIFSWLLKSRTRPPRHFFLRSFCIVGWLVRSGLSLKEAEIQSI